MKKKIKFIIPILLIVILSISLLFVNSEINNSKEKQYCFSLDDIFNEINKASFNSFELLNEQSDMSNYLPLNYSKEEKILIAKNINDDENFFLIILNFSDYNLNYLKNYVEQMKKIDFERYKNVEVHVLDRILYLAVSKEYESFIEGIINSYIYCE